jgi:hypothetical protein
MKKALTYGDLFDQLKDLGFTLKKVEYEGLPQLAFTHSRDETALILLPEKARKEPVWPLHLAAVRTVLQSHGIGPRNGELASL